MLHLTTPDFSPTSSSHGLEQLCPSDLRMPFLRFIFQEFGASFKKNPKPKTCTIPSSRSALQGNYKL